MRLVNALCRFVEMAEQAPSDPPAPHAPERLTLWATADER
jgi:hypothetical protein